MNDRSRVAPDGARRRFHRFALDLPAVVYVAGMAAPPTSKLRSAVMIAIGVALLPLIGAVFFNRHLEAIGALKH